MIKEVTLKTGTIATFYFSEGLQRWTSDLDVYLAHLTPFEKLMDGTLDAPGKEMSSIKEFYENTSEINRTKIREMINEDVKNVHVVYDMILTAQINRKRR